MKIQRFNFLLWRAVAAAWLSGFGGPALANPTGMTVASGTATSVQSGPQLTITTSQSTFLNWQSFNIAAGETTTFNQPSVSSVVVNRINDPNPSQIFGSLLANGVVVLMNSSGFFFGPNSYVKTGGLIVSTANCLPPQNTGGPWEFNGPPPAASIINYGKINVVNGGPAFLIAENVANFGDIIAPGGTISIAAGQDVLVSERPDGRGLSMKVNLPEGSVDNEGRLIADAGTITVNAQVVNQNGFIQANSVRNQNGVIELVASDKLNLGANSQITANGDDLAAGSSGGNVTLQSGNTFSDATGSQIDVRGGAQGGNGGNVEISAPDVLSLNSGINAGALSGWMAGRLLLDPDYIILDSSGSGSAGSGTVLAGDNPGTTLDLNVNSAFANLNVSAIILQAAQDITLADGLLWNLSGTIGANSGGVTSGHLTLEAGNNIIFGDNSAIYDANNWSVTLKAGVNNFNTGAVQPGKGNIYLNGGEGLQNGGSIQTASGSIDLTAGQNIEAGAGSLVDFNFNQFSISAAEGSVSLTAGNDIQIGSGYVETTDGGTISLKATAGSVIDSGFIQTDVASVNPVSINVLAGRDVLLNGGSAGITTLGGGDIDVTAVAGSVNTGASQDGFTFYPTGYGVNIYSLGGISTASGGNVNITAGLDIVSFLPSGNNTAGDAGSGAFGVGAPGNVTLTAGRNVTGHYVVADGTGTITAGSDAGTSSAELALSLVNGGWAVNAAHDINLQEVRNPNGILNYANSSSPFYHYFDYGSDDYVDLNAGNKVHLWGNSLPRSNSDLQTTSIYPSILDITAGAGGIEVGGQVILFPSPAGSLEISTTGGGALTGDLSSSVPDLIMSDSGSSRYMTSASFGAADHAATPVHYNSPTPVTLDISGDMNGFYLVVPEAAQINVVGDMNNCSFQGQNLHPTDVTSINVGQTAKMNMEDSGVLDPLTDSGIHVGGDILNQNAYNSVSVSTSPDLSLLLRALGASYSDLFNRLFYDPTSGLLTLQGVLGQDGYNALTSLTVQALDSSGQPEFTYNADGTATPVPETVSILDPATAALLQSQSQHAPPTPNPGYVLGGGGTFDITAHTLDLGSTLGIQTVGPAINPALHNYYISTLPGYIPRGADINVNLTGDLDMFATTISTLNGGNISVDAAGAVNVGSTYVADNDQYARGIYTTGDGGVSVIAGGNIEVAGSRIAAYDGGNVTVESLHGNVDAGNGGNGSVTVGEYYVDPVTGAIEFLNPTIPLSGILAMTFPPRGTSTEPVYPVGNLFIEAPEGNVTANAAGILQIALNGSDYPDATTTVLAGYGLNNNGEPDFALSDQNVVTFGSAFALTGVDATDNKPVTLKLTPLLDAGGAPVLDAAGQQLYVENLGDRGGPLITCSVNNGTTFINPYLDAGGNEVNVVLLQGAVGAQGNPVYAYGRNIDVKGSGVVASNLKLLATGDINGLIFARDNLDINAQHTVDITALAGGNASITGPTIIGTISAVGGESVSGDSITANLISANVSGATAGQSGLGQGAAANSTSQGLANNASTQADAASDQGTDDEKKKKGKEIALAQKVGRVTVILPPKKVSETWTPNPGT